MLTLYINNKQQNHYKNGRNFGMPSILRRIILRFPSYRNNMTASLKRRPKRCSYWYPDTPVRLSKKTNTDSKRHHRLSSSKTGKNIIITAVSKNTPMSRVSWLMPATMVRTRSAPWFSFSALMFLL